MPLVEGYSSSSESEHEDKNIITSEVHEACSNKLDSKLPKKTTKRTTRHSTTKLRKLKKKRNGSGPWASWSDENDSNSDSNLDLKDDNELELMDNEEFTSKIVETSNFYGQSTKDYQGRSFLYPPIDTDIDFQKPKLSFKCFIPKTIKYKFKGHENGTTALSFFPKSGHMFLSGGNDNTLRLWDVYHERKCLRDYLGHTRALKSFSFNDDGSKFLSSSYDQTVKMWDTETGKIITKLKLHSIPNDLTFRPLNPDEYIVGLSNSTIKHFDNRVSSKQGLVQTYDHHLSSILKLQYFPDGSKFISSSEDKTVKIWENQINVPIKHISDTSQYSMPFINIHPENNYFCTQSMDNAIYTFNMKPKYRRHPKKIFKGHSSAGYAIGLTFSPDGKYICSGDIHSNVFIWDWKTNKLLKKITIPGNKPITQISWHPQETSKVLCSGNKGTIYMLD
ncbi:hypothetical protein TBLA_0A03750 [Henningerozyma blattae CBS 6284]|uniref:Pre-mRNA-processing factor 17 n=1 Tax=Henningerozyma blattae (strain ATCC 34711 / CBS 6284 / DSM 70876 / NBRC 10599 / NRRL Y-10934 / UCD 77-7) TaxID=1071380 RepID=I2GVM1_HENB6|nr:hypothetical protein TBLA_0A03750 [Tetrapisispora blattae CBS 6284]CCH58173.1 hypothetical protein TBLA_0A03750 [Tetrapisispora blattae CBS 6284]